VATSRRRRVRRRPPEVGVELISTFRPTADTAIRSTPSPSRRHLLRRIPRGTVVPPLIVAHRLAPVAPVFPSSQV